MNATPRRRRRRGRARRTHPRTITTSIGTVLLGGILGLILVLALVLWPAASPGSREPGRREAPPVAHEVSHRPASRPVLRYSVVAGGVYEASEVTAIKSRDPLVARHYEDIVPAALRPMTVGQDRLVYVSYRKHDTIYWTKGRVLLRSGDAILTDGTREIRSRCGNRISMYPLLPVAEEEPTAMELDALVDDPQPGPETQVAALPLLERRGRTALAFAPPVPPPLSHLPTSALLSNTGGTSESRFTDSPGNRVFAGPTLFSNPPGLVDTQTRGGDAGRPAATSAGPESGDPLGGGDPGRDPKRSDGPRADPPTDGPPHGPTITAAPGEPPAPQQPLPVPEPTTLLLLGGGLAGLVLRRMRQ